MGDIFLCRWHVLVQMICLCVNYMCSSTDDALLCGWYMFVDMCKCLYKWFKLIPVGCVPSAVAVSVYLVMGGCVPGPGDVPDPRGVYLVPGGGCVPGPRGCTCSRGRGCTWSGGFTWSQEGVCTWSWGVYLAPGGGVYLVLGVVPGPRGCTWSREGVYQMGVCTWSQACTWSRGLPGPRGVPGPGGCTWSLGGRGLGGMYLVQGCTWSWGGCLLLGGVPGQVLPIPPMDRHTCKNITFATSLWTVIIW